MSATTPLDIPRIHNELQQLRTQQFGLSVFAVLAALGLSQWMQPVATKGVTLSGWQIVVPLLTHLMLLLLLGFLFHWTFAVRRLANQLRSYLRIRHASDFERLFTSFRAASGAEGGQALYVLRLYQLLGGALALSYCVRFFRAGHSDTLFASVTLLAALGVFLFVITRTHRLRDAEMAGLDAKWRQTIATDASVPVARAHLAGHLERLADVQENELQAAPCADREAFLTQVRRFRALLG